MGCNCFGGSRLEKKKSSANSHHEIDVMFHWGAFWPGTLKSGIEVAVKTLSAQSKQGLREFLTEINTISNVRHPNLVELLGCCVQESNRILVYEYVENNSLDHALLGNSEKPISVLYEIEAWELYQEKRLLELLDPELEGYPEEEIIRYMKVAFFCSQATASRRPLMSQVVEMLSRNIRLNEKELTAPGFFTDAGESSSKKGSITESTSYQMSSVPETITQVTPR
ncbi:cold-responsive protein kinase 1 [Quercus suber]|uniref:Cold-responsive protein kinase 1 n=1 Tax=Quercus suber TaxID=58331 RepID=A0AAW0M2N2_QUESU